MGEATGIQWTEKTWNPWQGCQRVSPGCDNCYMFRDKARFGQDPTVVVRSRPATFNRPRTWNRDARARGVRELVFTASWADFFSREADAWRDDAWALIRECDSLVFQVLTKRHGRIAANLPDDWGDGYPNVWLGVSAEDREWWDRRVSALREVPARTKFVSYEPALGSIAGANATGIDWVIIGGESGHDARPFDVEWAREAIAVCRRDGAAPFVKQLGARPRDSVIRWLDPNRLALRTIWDRKGGDWDEWPADLRVREYPGTPASPAPTGGSAGDHSPAPESGPDALTRNSNGSGGFGEAGDRVRTGDIQLGKLAPSDGAAAEAGETGAGRG